MKLHAGVLVSAFVGLVILASLVAAQSTTASVSSRSESVATVTHRGCDFFLEMPFTTGETVLSDIIRAPECDSLSHGEAKQRLRQAAAAAGLDTRYVMGSMFNVRYAVPGVPGVETIDEAFAGAARRAGKNLIIIRLDKRASIAPKAPRSGIPTSRCNELNARLQANNSPALVAC